VLAYSNSKASRRSPAPTEKPWVFRFSGVVFVPRKSVASAAAGAASRNRESHVRTVARALI
jgi:hypothetical protein